MTHGNTRTWVCVAVASLAACTASGPREPEGAKQTAIEWIDANSGAIVEWSDRIWEFAEIPFEEVRSAALLTEQLEQAGFVVQRGVAGMPTAFVASYGSGDPVVGILAEYDAIPGVSQRAGVLVRDPIVPGGPGHGCGHNLIGAANVGAAIAVSDAIDRHGLEGTVKVFGTPAEEEYIPKVYMVHADLFTDVDAAILWHPGQDFCVVGDNRPLDSIVFTFFRQDTRDQSLENAVEAFERRLGELEDEFGREAETGDRSRTGEQMPSASPAQISYRYFFRAPNRAVLDEFRTSAIAFAQDVAADHGVTVTVDHLIGTHATLQNPVLAEVVAENLRPFLPLTYTPEEIELAREAQQRYGRGPTERLFNADEVLNRPKDRGAQDVGDVSWNVPLVTFHAAVRPVGIAGGHSWPNTALYATGIAHKGLLIASKGVAGTTVDLLTDPALLDQVQEAFAMATDGFVYEPIIQPGRDAMSLYEVIQTFRAAGSGTPFQAPPSDPQP